MRLAVLERPARLLAERQAAAAAASAAAQKQQQEAKRTALPQQAARAKPSRKGETAPQPEVWGSHLCRML